MAGSSFFIKDSIKDRECSYGRECRRPDCYFLHPHGRIRDELEKVKHCQFGIDCKRFDCKFTHPGGKIIDGVAPTILHMKRCDTHLSLEPVTAIDCQAIGNILEKPPFNINLERLVPELLSQGDAILLIKFDTPDDKLFATLLATKQLIGRTIFPSAQLPPPLPEPRQAPSLDDPQLAASASFFAPTALQASSTFPESTAKDILKRLKRIGKEIVIFVDGDNFPEVASILLERFPLPLPPAVDFGFMVIAFVGVQAKFKAFPQAAELPCFMYMRASTNSKDAADHCLTAIASLANKKLPIPCPLYICSRDGFARETATLLKQLKPERDILLMGKDAYANLIKEMQSRSLGPVAGRYKFEMSLDSAIAREAPAKQQKQPAELEAAKQPPQVPVLAPQPEKPTQALLAPTGKTTIAPAAASAPKISVTSSILFPTLAESRRIEIPGPEYPCLICKAPGGMKNNSHWYWECPFKTQGSSQRYVIDDNSDAAVILSSENERFGRFVSALLHDYLEKNPQITVVRKSNLGMLLRSRYVYHEKTGLKPLVTRAVQEGLITEQGDEGTSQITILEGPVRKYLSEATTAQPPGVEKVKTKAEEPKHKFKR